MASPANRFKGETFSFFLRFLCALLMMWMVRKDDCTLNRFYGTSGFDIALGIMACLPSCPQVSAQDNMQLLQEIEEHIKTLFYPG